MPSRAKSDNASKSASLLIGQDRCGQWVVRDPRGLFGGVFADRRDALRFAMFDNRRAPQSVTMTPYGLELDVTSTAGSSANPTMRRPA